MSRTLSEHAFKALTRLSERPADGLPPAHTLLRKFLLENQITVNQMSMMVCMNRKQLDALMRGDARSKGGYIQLHHAFAIEWATKGAVPAWLWLDSPVSERRIREGHISHLQEFQQQCLRHVLKWNSLKTADGMLREKARVLSRLFNVQWGEVRARAWLDAEEEAKHLRADISHLLKPEDHGPDDNGIYYHGQDEDQALTDEEWFRKYTNAQGGYTGP